MSLHVIASTTELRHTEGFSVSHSLDPGGSFYITFGLDCRRFSKGDEQRAAQFRVDQSVYLCLDHSDSLLSVRPY
jgi:hypothetical protein